MQSRNIIRNSYNWAKCILSLLFLFLPTRDYIGRLKSYWFLHCHPSISKYDVMHRNVVNNLVNGVCYFTPSSLLGCWFFFMSNEIIFKLGRLCLPWTQNMILKKITNNAWIFVTLAPILYLTIEICNYGKLLSDESYHNSHIQTRNIQILPPCKWIIIGWRYAWLLKLFVTFHLLCIQD